MLAGLGPQPPNFEAIVELNRGPLVTNGVYLHGGMTSWRQEGRDVLRIERMALDDLPARVEARPDLQLLDVRERAEWAAGHIPGSTFAPWHDIAEVPDGLEASLPIAVLCASGQRAAIAASLVQRFGGRHVVHVVGGGVPKLGRLGHPLERSGAPAPCSS
jgi:rhodanese-related sulfurtransferase